MAVLAALTTVDVVNLVLSVAMTNLAVAAPLEQVARLGVIPAPLVVALAVVALVAVARAVVALVAVVLAELVPVPHPPRPRLLPPLHPRQRPLLLLPQPQPLLLSGVVEALLQPSWSPLRLPQYLGELHPAVVPRPVVV